MCLEIKNKLQNLQPYLLSGAFLIGILAGAFEIPYTLEIATLLSKIFMNLLKLMSIPVIFFSVASTIAGMKNLREAKVLGKKVVSYTLLTTILSAIIGLGMFLVVDPVQQKMVTSTPSLSQKVTSYWEHLSSLVPHNIIQPFQESNVIAVLALAVLIGCALLVVDNEKNDPDEKKPSYFYELLKEIYAVIMKITSWIVQGMPLGVLAFSVLFVHELNNGLSIGNLVLYIGCIVAANLLQGIIVLPAFLRFFKISPFALFQQMLPAISTAFFTKSSVAALPVAMKCAQKNANISKKVANFTFPLCTTINMNACAAFILITVLFVMKSYGAEVSFLEMLMWVVIATIAAIGNAGVPMGCFFLASSLLASMDFPLTLMGIILPFYAFIDMLETGLNIWSDSCVAAAVDKSIPEQTKGL
jgi:Na+/H+-dicarboxylate symporter